jgi:hypothetical protein
MIFKAYQPLTGKWFYYDKIQLFKEKAIEWEAQRPLCDDEISLLPEDVADKSYAHAVDLVFQNGYAKTVYFNQAAYLMNDEGRTIEAF